MFRLQALYSAVVPLSADSRVKVRKAAHTVIVSLWDQHREFLKSHDGGATGQFFMTLVKSGLKVTGDAMQQVLSGLNLLAEIWGCLKPKAIVSIAAEVFKLWGRQQPMIKLMCLQVKPEHRPIVCCLAIFTHLCPMLALGYGGPFPKTRWFRDSCQDG